MGKIFVISDIWLNRPTNEFSDMSVSGYNNAVIDKWNSKVGDDDTVYLLGGIGVGDVYDILCQLNGNILILNNFYTNEDKRFGQDLKKCINKSSVCGVKDRISFLNKQIVVLPDEDCVLSYMCLNEWYGKESGTLCFHGLNVPTVLHENNISCNALRNGMAPISIEEVREVKKMLSAIATNA